MPILMSPSIGWAGFPVISATPRLSPSAPKLHLSARNPASAPRAAADKWRVEMLETIAIILVVLWLLGVVSGYTMGNFIYVLLVVAIVLFLVRLIGGRRVV
jgi:hypothetical protein